MNPAMDGAPASGARWMTWLGWVLSLVPVGLMFFSASLKFGHSPAVAGMFAAKFGWNESMLTGLGILEVAVALIYLIPPTSVLGAILVTGYLGGAIATHVRVADPGAVMVIGLGILVWAGLFLRDARIRNLIPFRRG